MSLTAYEIILTTVVISQTISPHARLQPLGVGIYTHTLPIENKDALIKACMPYVVLKPA